MNPLLRKSVVAASVTLACLALGACRHGPAACAKPGVYAQAQSIPGLRIPSGLQAPDTRGALRIPELNQTEQPPLPPGADCLERPPRYAPNARLTNPDADKKGRRKGRKEAAPAPAPTAAPTATPTAPTP